MSAANVFLIVLVATVISELFDTLVLFCSADAANVTDDPPLAWGHGNACPKSRTTYTYTALSGTLSWDWDECPVQCRPCHFAIHVPEQYEIVAAFTHLNLWFRPGTDFAVGDARNYDMGSLPEYDELMVTCYKADADCSNFTPRQLVGNGPFAPAWYPGNRLRFRLFTKLSPGDKLGGGISPVNTLVRSSKLNISFTARERQYCRHNIRFLYDYDCPYRNASVVDFVQTSSDFTGDFEDFNTVNDTDTSSHFFCPGISIGQDCFPLIHDVSEITTQNLELLFRRCIAQHDSIMPAFLEPKVTIALVRRLSRYFLMNEFRVQMGVERYSSSSKHLSHLYRFMWWWRDQAIMLHDTSLRQFRYMGDELPHLHIAPNGVVSMRHDWEQKLTELEDITAFLLCQTFSHTRRLSFHTDKVVIGSASEAPSKFPTKRCPGGFYVHRFLPCDGFSTESEQVSHRHLPLFLCNNGVRLHYTLACDGYDDCGDQSDEISCDSVKTWIYGTPLRQSFFFCKDSKEAVDADNKCDGVPDCMDASDEDNCNRCKGDRLPYLVEGKTVVCFRDSHLCPKHSNETSFFGAKKLSDVEWKVTPILQNLTQYIVELNGCGGSYVTRFNESDCPESHVRCPGAYCIPTYMVNNGVYDCPDLNSDDEQIPHTFSCPGFYRCYKTHICLHNRYLCDGVHHCPLKDDERYCQLQSQCPENCSCEGLAVNCTSMIQPQQHPTIRYLDISGVTQPDLQHVHLLLFLQFLNLSDCSLSNLRLTRLEQLRVLDLSHNKFTSTQSISLPSLPKLNYLRLSGNPDLYSMRGELEGFMDSRQLEYDLKTLLVENTGIKRLQSGALHHTAALQHLDLKKNTLQLNEESFKGLTKLKVLEVEDPLACCLHSSLFPRAKTDCLAPQDELSSCSDLLRSDFFRVFLWTVALMALLGNGGVLLYRLISRKEAASSTAFIVLVSNLCISDFIMGVYLVIIGSADLHFKGRYMWEREAWSRSTLCQIAGFLGLMSSEVSAFLICLITLNRLLVLRFPLKRHMHLKGRVNLASCLAVWMVGVILAAIPLRADWQFYSQNGICLPLPITRKHFPGHVYAFAIFICLNFLLFLVVGAGQMSIYRVIYKSEVTPVKNDSRRNDLSIARSLFLVAFTDFCCWFPIGVMGLLAAWGYAIPGEVNVWAAVFILPLNSALNPFLYTLNTFLERRRSAREREHADSMLASFRADLRCWPPEVADQMVQALLYVHRSSLKTLTKEQVMVLLQNVDMKGLDEQQKRHVLHSMGMDAPLGEEKVAMLV